LLLLTFEVAAMPLAMKPTLEESKSLLVTL
jgi:hypothetical protein